MPSGKAAVSEGPKGVPSYVEGSERCENAADGLFQHPVR